MIVGHNPTLSDLVSLLRHGVEAAADLRPEERAESRRSERIAGSPGLYELNWLAPPRLLRRLGTALDD